MRVILVVLIGVSVLAARVSIAQMQPTSPNDPAYFMTIRQEIAQAGALVAVDAEAAREALRRAVAGLAQADGAAAFGAADYAAMADLASRLDVSDEMRKTLASCWLDRVAADETFRSAMSSRQLLALGRLAKTAQPSRLDVVLAVVTSRLELVQQLPEPGVVVLCDLLEACALGGESAAEGLADLREKLQNVTTTKNGRFSKELAPFEIVRLAEYYTATGNAASDVAERLRVFVVREYLAEPGIAAAMRLADWSELLDLLAGSRDDALRREMVTLTVRHAGPAITGARRDVVADLLKKVEQAGGTPADANALAARWMGVEFGASADVAAIRAILDVPHDQAVRAAMVKNLDDREAMAAAVEVARTDRDDAVAAAMKTLRQRHDAGQLTAAGYALACRLARESGSAQATEFWSDAALEQFLKSTGHGNDALALLEAAASTGLDSVVKTAAKTDDAATASDGAETLQKLLARLRDFRESSWRISDATLQALAKTFDRAGLADTLYKSITLPDGTPDFIAVKLLAWIKREHKQIRPFIGQLAAPTAKTQGDARARWELARAYAVSLVEPRAPRRTDGNAHIRLALQASRSDTTLIMCLEELINACKPTRSYTFPLQIITSTKDRLEGQTKQHVEQLEQQLRKHMAQQQPTANATAQPTAGSNTTTNQPTNWQTIYDKKRQQHQRG